MTSPSAAEAEAIDLARSLDGSLAGILDPAALLESAEHDRPLAPGVQEALLGLGWVGIALTQEAGGLDLDPVAVAKLAAVAGRRLLPAAVRGETFVLAPALASLAGPGSAAAEHLEALLAGELRGGGSVVDAPRPDGLEALVALAPGARLAAIVGAGWGAVVDLDDPGVEVQAIRAVEPGQGMALLRLTAAPPAECLLRPDDAERVRRGWELAVFCEAFGAAQRALELSADYATQREQFGRRIVTFQAVSHRLAAMATELEGLDAAIGRLVASAPDGDEDLASVLCHAVPAGCRTVCESAIQVHGGMGFTWEFGLHLHYRRILDLQYALGGAGETLRRAGARYLVDRRTEGSDD